MTDENVIDAPTELARTASCEIMSISRMLSREANQDGFDDVLRGGLKRIHDLASVCLSVVDGDDLRRTEDMHKVIFGNVDAEVTHV